MAFCTLGPIWSRNARLARWGRSTPFPHAYRENRPIFRSMGFPRNPSWIMCRWTLRGRWAPPEHPRDTSHAFSARCLRLPIRPVPAWTSQKPQIRRRRRGPGTSISHILVMAGGAGGGSPPLFSYLNMLFNGALVNISNFCNLYYISYIKKKPLKSV